MDNPGGDSTPSAPPPAPPPPSPTPDDGGSLVPPPTQDDGSLVVIKVPRWVLLCLGGLVGLLASYILIQTYLNAYRPRYQVPYEVMQDLGLDGVIMFRQHDRNSDGVLDILEFEPLAHRLLEMNVTHEYKLPLIVSEETVTLQIYFSPLDLSTLSKDLDSRPRGLDPLHGLKRWKKAYQETMVFSPSHFKGFFPKDMSILDIVGEVYWLIAVPEDLQHAAPLSANRYVPPRLVEETDILIHKLLTMLHRYPFILSRFKPHGSVAVVRAFNQHAVDIYFRIHAEFQLNEPPFNPFWFTPGQFTGNLIIDRDLKHVHHFDIHVPTSTKLNVDMEWLTGKPEEQNMEVDIGFLPQLTINISSITPTTNKQDQDQAADHNSASRDALNRAEEIAKEIVNKGNSEIKDNEDGDENANVDFGWTQEISAEDARRKMEVTMYPFKKVTYHNISEAFRLAKQEEKLVHHILLWGALDDQSC